MASAPSAAASWRAAAWAAADSVEGIWSSADGVCTAEADEGETLPLWAIEFWVAFYSRARLGLAWLRLALEESRARPGASRGTDISCAGAGPGPALALLAQGARRCDQRGMTLRRTSSRGRRQLSSTPHSPEQPLESHSWIIGPVRCLSRLPCVAQGIPQRTSGSVVISPFAGLIHDRVCREVFRSIVAPPNPRSSGDRHYRGACPVASAARRPRLSRHSPPTTEPKFRRPRAIKKINTPSTCRAVPRIAADQRHDE